MPAPISRTVTTIDELEKLWIGSAVLTFDQLVWQANRSSEGRLWWSSTVDGGDIEVTSEQLVSVNQGHPLTVIHDVEMAN